jgi:hypothetical protein
MRLDLSIESKENMILSWELKTKDINIILEPIKDIKTLLNPVISDKYSFMNEIAPFYLFEGEGENWP